MREKTIIQDGAVRTLCRMCNSRCGIVVRIQGGVMTEITPDPDNPVNRGRVCPRGHLAVDHFYHEDRILTPLKKDPDGGFRPISREQAMDEIAGRMRTIRDRYGASAMGVWKGEGVGFIQQEAYARRFTHAFGSPTYMSNDSACFNGRYLGNALVTGFWNPYPDFSGARLIILIGTNPPVCHPPFMREFADARAQGARLVVIDPRLNPIGCWANIFAQPVPGTDGALIWGLIREIIRNDAYDRDFVARYTIGFQKIADYAKSFTPERVERESGVWPETLRDMVGLIMENRPRISFYAGTGIEHNENGVNAMRAMVILACLCGTLDTPWGLAWPEKIPLSDLTLPVSDFDPERPPIGAKRFPAFYRYARECHTMTALDHMLGNESYPLKGMIVSAANPAVTHPNVRKVEAAFSSLDLLVVNDFFMTATARLAHYIIPGTTFLERSEVHVNLKFQRVFLTPKVAEIPGVPEEYHLWRDLAHRLGFGETAFPWETEKDVNRFLLEPSGLSLENLASHPEGICYAPLRYGKHHANPLPTESGKVEFASRYLKELGLPEIPEYARPERLTHPPAAYPFLLTTGGRMTLFYHSRHQNIPRFRKVHPAAELEIHPDDAARLGIASGDWVRVISEVGSMVIAARVVHPSELRKGVVEVYHGWEDLRANALTPDAVNDPISGFPLLKGVPVRIEKADPAA